MLLIVVLMVDRLHRREHVEDAGLLNIGLELLRDGGHVDRRQLRRRRHRT